MKRYIHTADAVFALILFCAFAISMLMVLMAGAQSYQGVRERVENHYSEDTAISYIAMKARHFDDSECRIEVGTLAGGTALYMTELFDGEEYVTVIYYHDGYIKEIFADIAYEIQPEDGFQIVAARGMDVTALGGGKFSIRCVGTGGAVAETLLALRSGVGA